MTDFFESDGIMSYDMSNRFPLRSRTQPERAAAHAADRGTAVASFVFTLYGDLVYRHIANGRLWTGRLIQLMAPFGFSEAAVRQAVSRMVRQGWLDVERKGKHASYGVTERGRRRIEALSPRIYGPLVSWDGAWRMLAYDARRARREQRERFRKDLRVLGWAPLSSFLWISPNDSLATVEEALDTLNILEAVALFHAEYRGPHSDRELLERCWDLPRIAAAYEEFLTRYAPRHDREREHGTLGDEAAFVESLCLLHGYRKFVYLDPGLPSVLLPAHWPGTQAGALFRRYRTLLDAKAVRFLGRSTAGP